MYYSNQGYFIFSFSNYQDLGWNLEVTKHWQEPGFFLQHVSGPEKDRKGPSDPEDRPGILLVS